MCRISWLCFLKKKACNRKGPSMADNNWQDRMTECLVLPWLTSVQTSLSCFRVDCKSTRMHRRVPLVDLSDVIMPWSMGYFSVIVIAILRILSGFILCLFFWLTSKMTSSFEIKPTCGKNYYSWTARGLIEYELWSAEMINISVEFLESIQERWKVCSVQAYLF